MRRTAAYDEGREARACGYARSANPYGPGQLGYRDWDDGWCAPRHRGAA